MIQTDLPMLRNRRMYLTSFEVTTSKSTCIHFAKM